MTALLLALALSWSPRLALEDARTLRRASRACDLVTLRSEWHRVRLDIAQATREAEQRRLWGQFNEIGAAIRACGVRA